MMLPSIFICEHLLKVLRQLFILQDHCQQWLVHTVFFISDSKDVIIDLRRVKIEILTIDLRVVLV